MSVLCARVDSGLRGWIYAVRAPTEIRKARPREANGKALRKMHRRDRERRDLSRLFYNVFGLGS